MSKTVTINGQQFQVSPKARPVQSEVTTDNGVMNDVVFTMRSVPTEDTTA